MRDLRSQAIVQEQQVWARKDSLEFFSTGRNRPEDLYPSERFFLPDVLAQVDSCLDVGCAAGGFAGIMKTFNPALRYTGMDVNPEFVQLARASHPGSEFLVGDGVHFDTPPDSYDLVFSTGLFHLNRAYPEMTRSCYEQARRFFLCDFRLTYGESVVGTHRVDFGGGDGPGDLPYYVVNVDELTRMLTGLRPRPISIKARGYFHPPSANASVPLPEVLMAFFLVEKGHADTDTAVSLDFPAPVER
jgi:SAM-dependent methyltransferase